MKRTSLISTLLVVALVIYGVIAGLSVNEQKTILQDALNTIETHSGVIEQLSGKVNQLTAAEVSEEEVIIEEEVEVDTSLTACAPGPQPTEAAGNYSGNTEILNNYAYKVGCILPQGSYNSIVFNLDKPLSQDNQIHVWFKDTGIYGRLVGEEGMTFVHMFTDEIMTNNGTGNLFESLTKNDVALSTYIAAFDGNYIKSIELQ